jgi:hypothetical protein
MGYNLLEKLMVAQTVKKLSAFYETLGLVLCHLDPVHILTSFSSEIKFQRHFPSAPPYLT